MTATDTVLDRPETAPADAEGSATPVSRTRAASLAMGLWVVVAGLLAYGVVQTALKASALLG